ncbi:MAG TPA: twin-arginine translocase subunit TatC [Bacteroidia bacterium]|nr:twin-arginine translocase subunit TatC [Bacteroidia bacterium]
MRAFMGLFSTNKNKAGEMSFLGHVEALRWHLVRSAIVVVVLACVCFCYPEILFHQVIMGPSRGDFFTYTFLCHLGEKWGMGDALCFTQFDFKFQSTDVTGQFTLQMWAALVAGIVIAAPYVLWELWRFIKPALKQKEVRAARGFIFYATGLFLTGVVFSYYVVTPMAVYFLGNYKVDEAIVNNFTIDSFISVVTTLVLLMGLVFELPIVIYFLARFGIITAKFMRKHRKHAIVVILIVAAVITPTTDVFTQTLVAVPLYILYEASVFVAKRVEKKLAENE